MKDKAENFSHQGYTGRIESTFRTEEVDGKPWLVIEVKDNGIGHSLDEMPEKNWEKYRRVRRLAESVGGSFEYKPIKGVGATAIARLPLTRLKSTLNI